MNFETVYKNINFKITLEKEVFEDITLSMGDKFNRLPHTTMIEIKKGTLGPYNIIIESDEDNEMPCTHYLSGVLLTTNEDELMDEVADYLEQENILDDIVAVRKKYAFEPGPLWR